MAKFNPKQVEDINAIIKSVEAELKPGMEIGAKERASLASLLQVNKIEKRPKHFKSKAEYSDAIVTYFVKEKGVAKNRFSGNMQTSVYII
jgi:hypothetical protein